VSLSDPAHVAEQYATQDNLRVRIETHERYGTGPSLEAHIDALLRLQQSEDLLDVGTGPGDFPARLRAAGHTGQLVGADLSEGMVRQARERHQGVEFLQANAEQLPFPDGTFDVGTARHMLYHVPNIPAALKEFNRVLRPGGRFLAVTNADGYMRELRDVIERAARHEPVLAELLESRAGSAVFSETNGEGLVHAAFGNAGVTFLEGALVFPDATPVVRYVRSMTPLQRLPDAARSRALEVLREELDRAAGGKAWRVSKRVAFILATRATM